MNKQATSQRPPFKLSGMAAIKHLNVRKEGPDDEKILAVDVKLEFKKVDRQLCAYFDDALEAFLWRGDTNALIVRNAFLLPVVYLHTIASAQVKIGTKTYFGCEVKKFGIQPNDGGVITLTCSVSLNPSASEVSDLAKLVQDEERVEIDGPPDLFAVMPDLSVDGAGNVIITLSGIAPEAQLSLDDGPDPEYDRAVDVVLKNGKASISLVQRHLKIGCNRAARLVDRMEVEGKVSAMGPSGVRTLVATAFTPA